MIDNFKIILPLLTLDPTSYHHLQIIKRKKDPGNEDMDNGQVCIKDYYIDDRGKFKRLYEREIKPICDTLNARAYICLNAKSWKITVKDMAIKVANIIREGTNYRSCKRCLSSISDTTKTIGNKYWILDIDTGSNIYLPDRIKEEYFITYIPTVNGCHIVTSPFNQTLLDTNGAKISDIIHKQALTLLYYNNK